MNNHNFPTVVVNGVPVAGPCSKCALLRSELLDNAGILQGCQVKLSSSFGSSKPPKNTRGQALITASTTGAEFEASNKSSSTVAKSVPEAYDIFAHVCQSGTYIPVKRLQNLLIHEPPRELTIRFLHKLQSSLLYSDTFRSIAGGSV